MRSCMGCMLSVVALLATASGAFAADVEKKSFSLRLAAAQSRFARFTDSAGLGGAGAGSPWSSSPNPASTGMNASVGPSRWGTSLQYALLSFDAGTLVHVGSLSGAHETCSWGNWQPSVLYLASNRATTRDGLEFAWEAWSAEVQWGRKVTSDTSVGVNVSYLGSSMDYDLGPLAVSSSTSDTWGLRVGVLHEVSERLFVGATLDGQVTPSDTTVHDFMGLGIGDVEVSDTMYTLMGRVGLYTFLTKDLTLYADVQAAYFTDDTGSLVTYRLFAGLDQTVIRGLYVRAGTVLDAYENAALALGIGITPSERLMIDVVWQYDMFPEITPEFGVGQTFGVGLTVLF